MKPTILMVIQSREPGEDASACLRQAGFEALAAPDATGTLEAARRIRPDLLFVDLTLPGRAGRELVRQIKADPALASVPLVLLTGVPDQAGRVEGMDLPADEFIVRPFEPSQLAARARLLLARRHPPTEVSEDARLSCRDLVMDPDLHLVTVGGKAVELTLTEFELLRIFLRNPGCALSRSRLQQELGLEKATSGRVLDGHVKNLRRKIEHNRREPGILQTVYGLGYRLACS